MRSDVPCTSVPEIRPREFSQIREFVLNTFGLDLRQGKERLVSARLGKHLRAGGFGSFESYFKSVREDTTGESLIALIDALTTNHTSFLREPEQFRFLSTTVLQQLQGRRSIQLWSAASSTGEEAYTMLFSLLESPALPRGTSIQILGTDISTRAVHAAQKAIYSAERMATIPPAWKNRFFDRLPEGLWRVKAEYRQMTDFRRLNLMDPFPLSCRFPVIFCRNVMIYFQKETQAGLVRRMSRVLDPGGYLFVGLAESLIGMAHDLRYVMPAVYRRNP